MTESGTGQRRVAAGEPRYRLLGPVSMGERTPTATKLRMLLAALLLNADKVVSSDVLIDELWGDEPPRTVATTLKVYVSQLRNLLDDAKEPDAGRRHRLLRTEAPGYRLRIAAEELDLARFDSLRRRGRGAAERGDHEEAAIRLRDALAQWSGATAFANIPHGPMLTAAAVHLEEARLDTLERRIAADLRLGRHREIVPELFTLCAEHPYREALHGDLMVALYRSDRRSDALLAFRRLRRALADELGIDPGVRLIRLHEQILRSDAQLLRHESHPRRCRAAAGASAPVHGLPPGAPELFGRCEELALVERIVTAATAPQESGRADSAVVRVIAVCGPAGVGKTAFALEVAARHADAFTDGRLLIRLRDERGAALEPDAVVAAVLHGLGAPPPSCADAACQGFDHLSHRRILIVLDDAVSERQVAPVARALHAGLLLVTSRRALVGLDSARRLRLGVLDPSDAERMLLEGPAREQFAQYPASAREIARLCGGLPLALRTAAALLTGRPHGSGVTLARRLGERGGALETLAIGEFDLRATLTAGYREAGEADRRAFRLLSMAPESGFCLWTARLLLGEDRAPAEHRLERLVDAGLLDVVGVAADGGTRYGFHRLVRELALECAAAGQDAGELADAASRLVRGTARLVRWADARFSPRRPGDSGSLAWDGGPRAKEAYGSAPGPDEIDCERIVGVSPASWFQQHWQGLVSAVVDTAGYLAHGGQAEAEAVWQLADALSGYLQASGNWQAWAEVLERGMEAARRGPGTRGRAAMLRGLGDLAWQRREERQAAGYYSAALASYRGLRDRSGEGRCLVGMGDLALGAGDEEGARVRYEQAIDAVGGLDARTAADALRGLALVDLIGGRLEQGLRRLEEFTEAAERLGDQRWVRFGQRQADRVRALPRGLGGQGVPEPAEVELRPGVWLMRS